MPFVNQRWLGGMLTNFPTVHKRLQRLKELEEIDFEDVPGSGMTKKELLHLRRERDKLDRSLGGIKDMARVPSALWVVDTKKEHIAVSEARKLGIPVIAVLDTNCDPDEVDYPIPGNDDAIRSVSLLTRVVADAVADGLMARGAAADSDDKPRQRAIWASRSRWPNGSGTSSSTRSLRPTAPRLASDANGAAAASDARRCCSGQRSRAADGPGCGSCPGRGSCPRLAEAAPAAEAETVPAAAETARGGGDRPAAAVETARGRRDRPAAAEAARGGGSRPGCRRHRPGGGRDRPGAETVPAAADTVPAAADTVPAETETVLAAAEAVPAAADGRAAAADTASAAGRPSGGRDRSRRTAETAPADVRRDLRRGQDRPGGGRGRGHGG